MEADAAPPEIMPGAEPFSAEPAAGTGHGALLLHGLTGCPQSLRGLGGALAAAGFAVEIPLLPGHGTSVADLERTTWGDWSGAAEMACQEMGSRCDRLVVGGLSAGGSLAVWLAAHHPELAGLVVVNPFVDPPAPSFLEMLRGMIDAGGRFVTGIGNDVADPAGSELAYEEMPIASLLSLSEALGALHDQLHLVTCPMLILNSAEDHVVPPVSGDVLAAAVRGPVERATLARSFHVATLDHDRDELERLAVAFAQKVAAA